MFNAVSVRFGPIFSSESFIILELSIRILIHLEQSFIWCDVGVQH